MRLLQLTHEMIISYAEHKSHGESDGHSDDDQNNIGSGSGDSEDESNSSTLILDATCAPQNIKYPQDIEVLNEMERFIMSTKVVKKMFQVSTLQALALGYSRAVIKTEELMCHGDIGLGTFEDVNGEMIVVDGHCYRADEKGNVTEAEPDNGIPFSSVTFFKEDKKCEFGIVNDIDKLKELLDLRIEEDFGLNSMYIVRIDGCFEKICARSESGYRAHHVTLKDALSVTQKDFFFKDINGTLVCVYYPDYMDGINAPSWHLHFVSECRKFGGHVFDLSMKNGTALFDKITSIEIRLPDEPVFDTYSLKNASKDEIKSVEQGK